MYSQSLSFEAARQGSQAKYQPNKSDMCSIGDISDE